MVGLSCFQVIGDHGGHGLDRVQRLRAQGQAAGRHGAPARLRLRNGPVPAVQPAQQLRERRQQQQRLQQGLYSIRFRIIMKTFTKKLTKLFTKSSQKVIQQKQLPGYVAYRENWIWMGYVIPVCFLGFH